MSGSTLLLNLAYVLLVTATLVRPILWLRLTLFAGAVMFVVYGLVADLWPMVGWNTVIGTMHARQAWILLRRRRSIQLTPEERDARDRYLPNSPDFDFLTLWRMGTAVTHDDGVLIEQGSVVDHLMLLTDGVVEVVVDGVPVARREPGAMLGEMSHLSGASASASVIADGPIRVHTWRQTDIHTLEALHLPSARLAAALVSDSLVNKVIASQRGGDI